MTLPNCVVQPAPSTIVEVERDGTQTARDEGSALHRVVERFESSLQCVQAQITQARDSGAQLERRLKTSTANSAQTRRDMTHTLHGHQKRALTKACAARMHSIETNLQHFKAERAQLLEDTMGATAARAHDRTLTLEQKCLAADARTALQAEAISAGKRMPVPVVKRTLLPAAAKEQLLRWFDAHRDSPFPTDEQKAQLALACGIAVFPLCERLSPRRIARLRGARTR